MTAQREANASSLPASSASVRLFTILGWSALVSCGGGLPLLHPARALPAGDVRAFAGMSGNVAAGGLASALQNARNEAANAAIAPNTPPSDQAYAKGALVEASMGPGLAPLAGARVGMGQEFEGGLTYTGRAVRADLRRSIDLSTHWSMSLGAGGTAALYAHQEGDALPGVDLGQLHGWGADIPVVVGYGSDADLYMVWIGVRGGWEHVDVSQVRSEPVAAALGMPSPTLSATRLWGGGLVGLAVGFRHVHVAMEMDAAYASITGQFNATHAQVAGLTLAPGSVIWWRF
jgi:hypothetical protein